MNTPPRPPRGCKYTIKLKILAAAVVRLRLHHRVDVLPDLALQENVVSHDVLDLDGVGPRVVEHLVEDLNFAKLLYWALLRPVLPCYWLRMTPTAIS